MSAAARGDSTIRYQDQRLKQTVRSVPLKPHVIYFRVIEREHVVRVLMVRHGARRRPRRFE